MAKKKSDIPLLQQYLIKNIKELRISLGYSIMQFAELTDKSVTYIGEIERGKKYPSASTLQKIADVLGVRPYQLFLSDEDKNEYDKIKLLKELSEELQQSLKINIETIIKKYFKK